MFFLITFNSRHYCNHDNGTGLLVARPSDNRSATDALMGARNHADDEEPLVTGH